MPEFNVGDKMIYIFPILLGFMLVEFLIAKHDYELKDSLAGFGIALGAAFVSFFTKAFTVAVVFTGVFNFFESLRVELCLKVNGRKEFQMQLTGHIFLKMVISIFRIGTKKVES